MTKLYPPSQYAKGRSRAVNTESVVNMFAEMEKPGAKEIFALHGRPGLVERADVGAGPIRGHRKMDGVLYVVSGNEVYKIASDWSATLLGAAIGGLGLVGMTDNGTQMTITASNGGKWVVTSSSVVVITDADLPNVYTCDYLDGYTIFTADDGKFYTSNLLDTTDIDPLDFATAESYPDDLIRVFVDHREVWLFGSESAEIWYSSGTTSPPLSRFNDAILEKGILSAFAVAKNDNTVFWVGNDKVIYRADNYSPQRISTHAIERHISSWKEAELFSFTMDGHTFVVVTSDNGTFVYDVSTDLWYEWKTYKKSRWIATGYTNVYGSHVVGDYQNGKIYTLDLDEPTDNGTLIRAEVELPPIHSNRDRLVMSEFEVDIESGVGLANGQGSDPQIMLQYSDNGFTWSSELWRSMGKVGEYNQRAIWRQVGPPFRQRTIRLAITDPVKRVIISHNAAIT